MDFQEQILEFKRNDINPNLHPAIQDVLRAGKASNPNAELRNEQFLLKNNTTALTMKAIGFKQTVVDGYTRDFETALINHPDEALISDEEFYMDYQNTYSRMDICLGGEDESPDKESLFANSRRDTRSFALNPSLNLKHIASIKKDINIPADWANNCIRLQTELNEFALELDDKKGWKALEKNVRKTRRISANKESMAHARYAFWLIDTIHSVYVLDPDLRPKIREFLTSNNNLNKNIILGDNVDQKIEIADLFMDEIISKIDNGIEDAGQYRSAFTEHVETIAAAYGETMATMKKLANFQIIKRNREDVKPKTEIRPEETSDTEVLEVNHVEDKPITPVKAAPFPVKSAPAESAPVTTPANQKSKADAMLEALKAQREWEQKQLADKAKAEKKAAKDAAELKILERELQKLEERERLEAENSDVLPTDEQDAYPDNVDKLYKSGEEVRFDDINKDIDDDGKLNETDDEKEIRRKQAIITRKKRRFDMKDAASCHGADKMVVLKTSDKTQSEKYMVTLEDPEGDKQMDIVMLDGDSEGTAAYIGHRQNINRAMKLAEVKARHRKDATEIDKYCYMLEHCRTEMRECGVLFIIHRKDRDMALEFDQAIEKLRPPVGELRIDR